MGWFDQSTSEETHNHLILIPLRVRGMLGLAHGFVRVREHCGNCRLSPNPFSRFDFELLASLATALLLARKGATLT